MDNEFSIGISIPTDDYGYILLQCSHCRTYFKLTLADIEDDKVLEIYCPSCGLISDNYLTEDVLELAVVMGKNKAMDMIYNELKKKERQFNKGTVTFKAVKRPKHEHEVPIRTGIEALEIATFPCCVRTAKVKPILKITGCYCPFCGVKNYEVE